MGKEKTIEETKGEAADLQYQIMGTMRELQELHGRILTNEANAKRATLTLQEFESYPESARMYETVGKCFVLTPLSEVRHDLHGYIDHSEKLVNDLRTRETALQKQKETLQQKLVTAAA